MNYRLSDFELSDMTHCGAALRSAGKGASSMEQVARSIVDYLYTHLISADGEPCCRLIRFFTTLNLAELEPDLQQFAKKMSSRQSLSAETKCLTLLGTAGARPEWNSRLKSVAHRAIPLPSEHAVQEIPMISQLIRQLGLEVSAVLRPDPELLLEMDQRRYNVFHVARAQGSPFIPAQDDFVVPHGISSVLGFGGAFPTGNIFSVLMFSKVSVPRSTAEMFRTAALNTKLALLPFVDGPYFEASKVEALQRS